MEKRTFNNRANDLMDTSAVEIALSREGSEMIKVEVFEDSVHGPVRHHVLIDAATFTPGTMMGAAEEARAMIHTALAIVYGGEDSNGA